MKKLLAVICLLVVCFFAVDVVAQVGTCKYHRYQKLGKYRRHKWTVTTDPSGDMTKTGSGCTSEAITGWLIQVEFWPDASSPWTDGTADIQLRGTNTSPAFNTDYDYAHGTGADLDSSKTDSGNIRAPLTSDTTYIWLHGIKLTPWVDEGGSTKTGIVYAIVIVKDG